MISGNSIAMPFLAKKVESKGVKTFKRRHLPASILFNKIIIIILISFSPLQNTAYAQNPYLHFAFNHKKLSS